MPEEQDGSGLLSASDKAIYEYLDEMLSDPSAGSGSPASATTELKSIAKAVTAETPHTLSKPLPEPRQESSKPLALKEKPESRVLSSPETLLRFEKPVVLQQPPVEEKAATKTDTKTEAEQVKPAVEAKAPPPVQAPAPEEPPAPPQTDIEPDKDIEEAEHQKAEERLPPIEPWCDNGRPEWAQERFECLLFEVDGLKLAVPLVTLGAVHRIDRKFNELPGQYDWFIGILQTNLGNIKVINTALCVMPERYNAASRSELEFVITLHGFEWGISCHKLLKSITLEPEDVKWRSRRGKRPWMAGTVVEQMCALIDPAGFHHVILQAERRSE